MAKYPLEPMLRVRIRHEDTAKRAVGQAEQDVAQAESNKLKAIEARDNYKKWLAEEEERRYQELLKSKVNAEELAEFREGLIQLAQGLLAKEDDILKAEENVTACQKKLAEAKNNYFQARRETLKIEEHKKIWITASNKEAERISDLEMEESVRFSPESSED